MNNENEVDRPLPPDVTRPDGILTDLEVHQLLTGQMRYNENTVYALAKEVARNRGIE